MGFNAGIGATVLAALLLSGCAATDGRPSQRGLGVFDWTVPGHELPRTSGYQAIAMPVGSLASPPPAVTPAAPPAVPPALPPARQDMSDFLGDKPHRVSASLGGAFKDGDEGFIIGADYEYRVKQGVGVGGLIEYAAGQLDSTTLAAAVYFHPDDAVRIVVASGLEHRPGDTDFLFRLGVSTEFPMENNFALVPRFAIDFVDGDQKLVFALGIALSF